MRWTLALIPLMVGLAGAAWGQTRHVDVAYTPLGGTPQRALRVADEAFISAETAGLWKWQVQTANGIAKVMVDGKTIDVPLRVVGGEPMLPVRTTVQELGGVAEWGPDGNTLEIASVVQSLEVTAEKIILRASLAARPTVYTLVDPDRLVIDLEGARLPAGGLKGLPPSVRVSQHRPNTVRVVREGPAVHLPPAGPDLVAALEIPLVSLTSPDTPPDPPIGPVEVPPSAPTATLDLKVTQDRETVTLLQIAGRGIKPPTISKPSPDVLEVRLPDTFRRLPEDFVLETPAVLGAVTTIESTGTVLTLTLARPMGAEVWSDANGIQIQLIKPVVGDGRLAGKIIVVDPGHGGKDSGAHRSGVSEKTIVLAVGKLLAENLKREGATVLMTRKDDRFIELGTRGALALQNAADFFVSIHVNSTVGNNRKSGTITFHHRQNPLGKLLAECIHDELAKVTGLPDIGVWSDGKIYDSGFKVLRDTKGIPGVLLELGFVNHSRDRQRMVTQDFQTKVAAAIAKGIKVYLGNGK